MRRALPASLTLTLLIPGSPARAIPPEAGGALASSNVEFVANLPDLLAIGAKVLGNRLYVTGTQGLRIYDISLGIPVPLGALELPHFENEAVDTNGKILLISADHLVGFPSSVLYVIDVSVPQAPLLKSVLLTESGHTATCIADCAYAWIADGSGTEVIDLTDPARPKRVARFGPGMHNFNVDASGIAWGSAHGGLYAYDVRNYPANGLTPAPIVTNPAEGVPFHDNFIIHNSIRPDAAQATPALLADNKVDTGEVVLVTEENYLGFCTDDGQFQTGWIHTRNGRTIVDKIDTYRVGQGSLQAGKKPLGVAFCSSHWFDVAGDVVADAWYEQGVRFLDVSNPYDIKEIGYFLPAVAETWMTQFHRVTDGPLPGLYVYTFDYARGMDILRFDVAAGAAAQPGPVAASSLGGLSSPSEEWGFACRIPDFASAA